MRTPLVDNQIAAQAKTRGMAESEVIEKIMLEPAAIKRLIEPAEVAAAATGPEMAAEIYLASVLVADETTTMERAYLDALAAALKLPPELRSELDARAREDR